MNITIRQERPEDVARIHDITVAAFLNAAHTDHTEQFIVNALREAGALSISLVAEKDGDIVGHVAISPVAISDGTPGWFGLGPISVKPDEQGKGIGSRLMQAALAQLEARNANGCVLLGDPGYYHRFGFKPLDGLTLANVPPEYFQAHRLRGNYPQGEVTYHAAFLATS